MVNNHPTPRVKEKGGYCKQEHIRMGGQSKNVKFETRRNLPAVLQIPTCPAHAVLT